MTEKAWILCNITMVIVGNKSMIIARQKINSQREGCAMSSMIERLSEIEETAEAIVEHAEEEKREIEKKIQAKRDAFDKELEMETREKVEQIRAEANSRMEQILEEQRQKNAATIEAMKRDFEEHHDAYAREILKHMIGV